MIPRGERTVLLPVPGPGPREHPEPPRLPRGRLFREHAEAERERHLPRHHHLDPAVRRDHRVAREGRREHGDLRQHGTGRRRDVRVRRGVQVAGFLRAGRIFRGESRRAEPGQDGALARVLRASGIFPSAEEARSGGPVFERGPKSGQVRGSPDRGHGCGFVLFPGTQRYRIRAAVRLLTEQERIACERKENRS